MKGVNWEETEKILPDLTFIAKMETSNFYVIDTHQGSLEIKTKTGLLKVIAYVKVAHGEKSRIRRLISKVRSVMKV